MAKTTYEEENILLSELTDEEVNAYALTLFELSKKVQDKITELRELVNSVDHKVLCMGDTALAVAFKCGPNTIHCALGADEDIRAACIDFLIQSSKGVNND